MNRSLSNVQRVVRIKDKRNNFLYIFIGTNRTGKSTTARKQVIKWRKNNPNKLVYGYDPQRRFRKSPVGTNPNLDTYSAVDLIDVHINPENLNWALEMQERRDCLLLIDDFRKLHEDSRPIEGLKKLMYDYCDFNIDIMTIFHNPIDVLTCIGGHATHYFIFMTNETDGQFKQKMPNATLCKLASNMVNEYVRKHGRGGPENGYKFPYIRIDVERQDLWAINMAA